MNANILEEFPILNTNRLVLRKLTVQDASSLYNNFSCDREVSKYTVSFGPPTIEDAEEAIRNWNKQFDEKRFIRWGITYKDKDEVIGTISAEPIFGQYVWNPVPPIEIGYDLSRRNWRKGIMTETANCIVDFLCVNLNVVRIQALVDPRNYASLNVLKKVGFNEEGLLKRYSYHIGTKEISDRLMFSLINSKYKKTW